jgi:signal transduction protein with GAF and PtsI domain
MRGNFSVRELSSRIINYLCSFLKAEMGAVYVYDEVLEHLEFTGSAGINKKEVKEKLDLGEGLIGKAALQTDIQILDTKGQVS